jgi:hypothetical protein
VVLATEREGLTLGRSEDISKKVTEFWERVSKAATKVKCPACHNDGTLKKNCIVCRGSGWVWK